MQIADPQLMLPEWKRLELVGMRKKSKKKTIAEAIEENLDRFNYKILKTSMSPDPINNGHCVAHVPSPAPPNL